MVSAIVLWGIQDWLLGNWISLIYSWVQWAQAGFRPQNCRFWLLFAPELWILLPAKAMRQIRVELWARHPCHAFHKKTGSAPESYLCLWEMTVFFVKTNLVSLFVYCVLSLILIYQWLQLSMSKAIRLKEQRNRKTTFHLFFQCERWQQSFCVYVCGPNVCEARSSRNRKCTHHSNSGNPLHHFAVNSTNFWRQRFWCCNQCCSSWRRTDLSSTKGQTDLLHMEVQWYLKVCSVFQKQNKQTKNTMLPSRTPSTCWPFKKWPDSGSVSQKTATSPIEDATSAAMTDR